MERGSKIRILTAAILIPLVLMGVFFLPPWGVLAVVFLLALLAGLEWGQLSHMPRGGRLAFALLVAGLTFVLTDVPPQNLAAAALVWWSLVLAEVPVFQAQPDPPIYRASSGLAGLVTLAPSLALLIDLIRADPWEMVLVLAVIWAGDSGAYVSGRALGRYSLVPRISSGKTWEGLAGGAILGSVAGALLAGLVPSLGSLPQLAGIGVVVFLSGQLGDLSESMLKRRAGHKDSGRWLPGHGGILDRIDSLTAAIPVYTFCFRELSL